MSVDFGVSFALVWALLAALVVLIVFLVPCLVIMDWSTLKNKPSATISGHSRTSFCYFKFISMSFQCYYLFGFRSWREHEEQPPVGSEIMSTDWES